jgi:hypothetical protein
MPTASNYLVCHRDAIPEDLSSKTIWLRWKLEERNGKTTKVPYRANGKGMAKTNDPNTWSSFEEAAQSKTGDGIGCVVKDGLVVIDLDKIRDPASGVIEPWAQAIIDECASYTEISPSKRGVHIWVRGEVPAGGNRKGRMEMYDRSSPRYMTVTGDVLNALPIRDIGLADLHKRMLDGADPKQAQSTVHNGTDDSAEDFAFCCALIERGKTRAEIDAAMRVSKLMRPKWDERHGSSAYGDRTITKAFTRLGVKETPSNPKPMGCERMEAVKPDKIEWVWEGRFPLGMTISLIGQGGVGKSMFTEDLASRVSKGDDFPDGEANMLGPADVILLNNESSASKVQRPRLQSMNADLSKIIRIKLEEEDFALDKDLPRLEENLKNELNVRLVVIDPIGDLMGDTNHYNSADTRRNVLSPLRKLARRYNVCVVVVCHTNKKEGMSAINRVDGTQAFVPGVDGSWLVLPCDEDEVGEGERGFVLQFNKSNVFGYKRGLKGKTVPTSIHCENGEVIKTAHIVWGNQTDKTAQETLDAITDPDIRKTKRAENWIKDFLCDEARSAKDVYQAGKAIGFSDDQLDRASRRLRVVKDRAKGYSIWSLPVGCTPQLVMESTPQFATGG